MGQHCCKTTHSENTERQLSDVVVQMDSQSADVDVAVDGTGTASARPLAVNEDHIDTEFVGDIKSDELEQEQRPQSNGM